MATTRTDLVDLSLEDLDGVVKEVILGGGRGRARMRQFGTLSMVPFTKALLLEHAAGGPESVSVATAVHWAECGFQSISMPHTYAAALMATDTDALVEDFPEPPWPAFEVLIPNNIIPPLDGVGHAEAVYYSEFRGHSESACMVVTFSDSRGVLCAGHTLPELVRNATVDDIANPGMGRALTLAKRLLLNAWLDVVSTPPAPSSSAKRARRAVGPSAPGGVRTIVIGRPLDIDCRRAIHDYVSGTRATGPAVTTLVRGHWRNQVHGAERAERKLIWIKPFFRGHGPMIERTTRLGFRHDAVGSATGEGSP